MHGGAIGFTSKEGVGSTFSFYVKSRKLDSPQADSRVTRLRQTNVTSHPHDTAIRRQRLAERDISQSLVSGLIVPDVPYTELHILVVEDNLVNQRVLAKQLRGTGMHVVVANHGGEALDYLHTTNYCKRGPSPNHLSLILMDWEMPVMNGLTCVARIRQMQKDGIVFAHVPVIAVTANVRSEQVQVALQAGMDDVISKPFRIPELCACIQKTLRSTVSC